MHWILAKHNDNIITVNTSCLG
uniref:Uncharacterized protein n=1 Tax=Tetranychus urticae TaxID=32264 RepID=T1KR02_TETUR